MAWAGKPEISNISDPQVFTEIELE
jgi:hypothetical protein